MMFYSSIYGNCISFLPFCIHCNKLGLGTVMTQSDLHLVESMERRIFKDLFIPNLNHMVVCVFQKSITQNNCSDVLMGAQGSTPPNSGIYSTKLFIKEIAAI